MAKLHVRSNSFPSNSNPVVEDVQDHLQRLRSSKEASTSATSVCADLASLERLHESINNLIQMPSIQQILTRGDNEQWSNQLLEESLALVDLCGFAREVLNLTKESILELQSSMWRSISETATTKDIHAYMASRKNISKMVSKFVKNVKCFKKSSSLLFNEDSDLKAVSEALTDILAFDFSILKSVLVLLSGENEKSKKRSWFLLSLFTQTNRDVQNVLKQFKSPEVAIQELEEELEAFYRTLVKTRVAILNALNH